KGVIPQPIDLSLCHVKHNNNAWYWLAGSDARVRIFQALLDKGIIPQPIDLSPCRSNNNTWYWLARSDARIPIFQALIDKGIIPQAIDLDAYHPSNNTNTWHCLVKRQAHKLLVQLLDLDFIPANKIEQMYATSEHQKIINKINKRRELLIQVSTDLKIKQNNEAAVLLTRDDIKQFYGFLYLFLGMENKQNPCINLPVEIWHQLGEYLLPPSITFEKFKRLLSDKNKSAIIKHHVTKLIDEYNGTFFRRHPHKNRAISLKQAIIENNSSPVELLYEQYCMGIMPGKTPYKNPSSKYQQSFTHKVTDDDFLAILQEGKFFR
ncbi:MAG: hypothetical protein K0S11_358, partial [Gammaproteobacteria bacterium]|nr:hypothetical protein [Gammaproteobacteria bacterium]